MRLPPPFSSADRSNIWSRTPPVLVNSRSGNLLGSRTRLRRAGDHRGSDCPDRGHRESPSRGALVRRGRRGRLLIGDRRARSRACRRCSSAVAGRRSSNLGHYNGRPPRRSASPRSQAVISAPSAQPERTRRNPGVGTTTALFVVAASIVVPTGSTGAVDLNGGVDLPTRDGSHVADHPFRAHGAATAARLSRCRADHFLPCRSCRGSLGTVIRCRPPTESDSPHGAVACDSRGGRDGRAHSPARPGRRDVLAFTSARLRVERSTRHSSLRRPRRGYTAERNWFQRHSNCRNGARTQPHLGKRRTQRPRRCAGAGGTTWKRRHHARLATPDSGRLAVGLGHPARVLRGDGDDHVGQIPAAPQSRFLRRDALAHRAPSTAPLPQRNATEEHSRVAPRHHARRLCRDHPGDNTEDRGTDVLRVSCLAASSSGRPRSSRSCPR